MINVHLLPTDQPSRLYKEDNVYKLDNLVYGTGNQNIYITNDETIKDRDWCYDKVLNIIFQTDEHTDFTYVNLSNYVSKIILTTDSKLIADSVQAIDNTFLEWYVKNLCKEVAVEENWEFLGDDYRHGGEQTLVYKIIIPKESLDREEWINLFKNNSKEEILELLLPYKFPL